MQTAIYIGNTVDDFRLLFDGIVTKIIIGNTLGKKHACNNTFLDTSQVRITVVFLMAFPLYLLVKLVLKILTNANTTGVKCK